MDALEAIAGRKVIRAFADRPVEPDKLRRIIDAGRHAMSARNLQPWQFIVVQDRARLKVIGELCSTGRFISTSPAAIVVLKDVANSRWADIDCAHAVQNMANAAWALGLGTCWVGNFDAQKIAAMLDVPQSWTILTILPFGYSDSANPAQPRPLKPRSEVVHYERFGQTKA